MNLNKQSGSEKGVESTPPVSVVMSVYNRPEYIAAAISSILDQTFTDFEFILINDGSEDKKCDEILADFAARDKRIRLISLRRNGGIVAARNLGFQEARGALVALMDSDDISKPERLRYQYDFLQAHPEVAVCKVSHLAIDESGKPFNYYKTPSIPQDRIYPPVSAPEPIGSNIAAASMMVRREAVMELGGYRSWFGVCAEDCDLSGRLEERYAVASLAPELYCYRLAYGGNMHFSPLCHFYGIAADISAVQRRLGKADPIDSDPDLWQVLALIACAPETLPGFVKHAKILAEAELAKGNTSQAVEIVRQTKNIVDSVPRQAYKRKKHRLHTAWRMFRLQRWVRQLL